MLRHGFEFRYDRWCGWLLAGLGLGPRWSGVVVDDVDRTVTVVMGWSFRAVIPVGRIVSVATAEGRFLAWGVHGWRGRWLVNGSVRDVVAVELDPPVRARVLLVPVRLRTLYLSLADRAGFEASLTSAGSSAPLS